MHTERLQKLTADPLFRHAMMDIFFEAGNYEYANHPRETRIIELPGAKVIPFNSAPWEVDYEWSDTPLGPRCGGTKTIFYEGIPVWMLQCLGQYSEEALPCLMAALRTACAEKKFFGGRGPEEFTLGEYVYRNEVERAYRGNFENSDFFQGYERVTRVTGNADGSLGKVVGWHSYQGMMMIPA